MRRDETASGLDETLTVEVDIPVRLLIKLHSVKALTGKSIDEGVAEALAGHFGGPTPAGGPGAGAPDLGADA